MKTLNFEQMEMVDGGMKRCDPTLAGIAFGAAILSMAFPPMAMLGWAAVGAWMGKCL